MNKSIKIIYLALVFLFLYFPIAVLVLFSFNHTSFSGLWHGFTWHWYQQLLRDSGLQLIAFHSLSLAILASSLAVLIGVFAAVAIFKYTFTVRKAMHFSLLAMIIIPDLLLGIALLLLFHYLHMPLGFFSLLIAHITFCVPFVFVLVYARLNSLDSNLFEAARDLGALDVFIFKKVLLPLLMPAIIAAWLLSFTMSLDDVVISFFVSGPSYQILPLYIFSEVRLGVTPELNALCSMILYLTITLALLGQFYLRKSYD